MSSKPPPAAELFGSDDGAANVAFVPHSASSTSTSREESADEETLLAFLEVATREIHRPFDRTAARRVLSDALAGTDRSSDPLPRYVSALSTAAAACGLRLDATGVSSEEAASLIRPTAPMGMLRIDEAGQLAWSLLVDRSGSRVKTFDDGRLDDSHWQPLGAMELDADSRAESRVAWLAVQPSLLCEDSVAGDAHGHAQTPLANYLQLLRPEKSDIGVILVFSLVVGLLALASPIAVESLVNTVAFGQLLQPVVVLAVILGTFLAFAAAMRGVQTYVAEIIQRRLFVRVAADVANRLPRIQNGFWEKHYGPELLNRFFEVVTVQKVTSQLLLDGTALVLQTGVGLSVIAFYHPALLGFNAFLILSAAAIIFLLGRGGTSTSIQESIRKYDTAAWLEELARHPMVFRSRQGMDFAIDQLDQRVADYLTARAAHFRVLFRQVLASLGLQVAASTVLLGLGGWLVIRGELTLGQLVAAELIVSTIVGSITKLGKHFESYYDVMASMQKLEHLFHMPMESPAGGVLPRQTVGMAVAVRDLTTEPTPSGAALRAASLTLEAGEVVAVTCSSGAILREFMLALVGLRTPKSGRVLVDEHDIRSLRGESVRDQIALIGDVEVFHGTVAENIHLGRKGVRDADVRAALQTVGLLDEVLELPQGIDTEILTEGSPLSRDQALRLTLARGLAGRPRLLLIDGSLDGWPDGVLHEVLANVVTKVGGRTTIIGTGRRDVAKACPRSFDLTPDGKLRETSK